MSVSSASAQPAAPGRALFRVSGLPVRVTGGGALLAGWLAWLYHGVLVFRFPDAGWLWLVSGVIPALLAGSVLLHEVGHAVIGSWLGLRVRWIVLDALGGETEFESEAPTPGRAAAVAAAGPAVSLALTVIFALAAHGAGGVVGFVLGQAALGNGVVAVFNLLPALPLDGGHVVRAAVWRLTGRERAGTVAAAVMGLVIAVTIVAVPLWLVARAGARPSLFGLAILLLVAAPVARGALGALRARATHAASQAVASAWELSAPAVTIGSGHPVQEGLRLLAARAAAALVVVNADGRVAGLVDETDLTRVPTVERGLVPLAAITPALGPAQVIPGWLAGDALQAHLRAHPARMFLLGDVPLTAPRVLFDTTWLSATTTGASRPASMSPGPG